MLENEKEELNIDVIETVELEEMEEIEEVELTFEGELSKEDKKVSLWKKWLNKRNCTIAGSVVTALAAAVVIVMACNAKGNRVVATSEDETVTTEIAATLPTVTAEAKIVPLVQMKLEAIADDTSITAKVLDQEGNQIAGHEFVLNVFDGSIDENKDAIEYMKMQSNVANTESGTEATTEEITTEMTTAESETVQEKLANAEEYKDDDKDGTLRIENLEAGTYTLAVRAKDGFEMPEAVETTIVKYEVVENIMEQVVAQDADTEKEDPQQAREPSSEETAVVEQPTETGATKLITVNNPVVDPVITSGPEYSKYVYTYAGTDAEEVCDFTEEQVTQYELVRIALNRDSKNDYVTGYVYSTSKLAAQNGEIDVIDQLIVEKQSEITANTVHNVSAPGEPTETTAGETQGTTEGTTGTAEGTTGTAEGTTGETEGTTGATDATEGTTGETTAPKQYVILKLAPVTESKEIEVYDGWVTASDGSRYFYADGKPYTGWNMIDGMGYYFNADGVQSSRLVIDVSTFNGNIDWNAVKASGIDYAIIRVGYRGWGTARLVLDNRFDQNMAGAIAAGLQVGAYIVTQAVNTTEAVEEASFIIEKCRQYNVTLPLAIDVESAGGAGGQGRGDLISVATRTEVINAFTATVRGAGYTPMVYANLNWLNNYINTPALSSYCQVWVAQYNDELWYRGDATMWQFTSGGSVNGIGGSVDVNAWRNE